MNRNTRNTLITLSVIAAIALGWYGIRHTARYGKYRYYHGKYDAVQGLSIGGPVYYKGVAIGKVSDIDLQGNDKVIVTFAIKKKYPLPAGSSAMLLSGGLMGSKDIRMVMGTGPAAMEDGSWIQTTVDTGLLESANAIVTPMLRTAKTMLGAFDTTLIEFIQLASGGLLSQTTAMVIGLDEKSKSFAEAAIALNRQSPQITALIDKLQRMTADPAGKNRSINESIRSAGNLTEDLAKMDIKENLAGIRSSMQTLRKATQDMNDPTTTLGKLNTDKSAYINTTTQLDSLNSTMQQFMANPPGISIFGGDKKK